MFKDVVFENGKIKGLRQFTGSKEFYNFSAIPSLFAIDLCMTLEPKSIRPIMDRANGYGKQGYFPDGYDWSGIRDSTPEAVEQMYRCCQTWLRNFDLEALGVPPNLVREITGLE